MTSAAMKNDGDGAARKDITPAEFRAMRPRVKRFIERDRISVLYRRSGARRYRIFPHSAAGKAESLAFMRGLKAGPAKTNETGKLTERELFGLYLAARASTLRPRTVALYAGRWRKWERFLPPSQPSETVLAVQVDQFRQAMTSHHAVGQIQAMIRVIKIVHNWAQELGHLVNNAVRSYRFKRGKNELVYAPAEYSNDEVERILRALGSGQDGRRWRAHSLVLLGGKHGERIKAMLNLKWAHVDWERERIYWPVETNKMGKARWVPMSNEAYAALLTALSWANRRAGDPHVAKSRRVPIGPYVFPMTARASERPYGYQAAWGLLQIAEREAGVEHRPYRAFHGLRKMAAGDVAEDTRNPWLALQHIGDSDPRRMKEYLKERDPQMVRIANDTRRSEPSRTPKTLPGKLPLIAVETKNLELGFSKPRPDKQLIRASGRD